MILNCLNRCAADGRQYCTAVMRLRWVSLSKVEELGGEGDVVLVDRLYIVEREVKATRCCNRITREDFG